MRQTVVNSRSCELRFLRCSFRRSLLSIRTCLFFVLCAGGLSALAGDIKINGLQFTLGNLRPPCGKSPQVLNDAGCSETRLLRIALLPVVMAKGWRSGFCPEIVVLAEVQETLRTMVKLEAQEFHGVNFLWEMRCAPRLAAEEALPKGEVWALKRVRVRPGDAMREFGSVRALWQGERAGELTAGGGGVVLRVDLAVVAR